MNLHFSSQFILSILVSEYCLLSTARASILSKCVHCITAEEKLQNNEAGPNCLIMANKFFLLLQNVVGNLLML